MPRTVRVTTGARLHFGPLSYRPATGRHFGGIGVMVDGPRLSIRCSAAPVDSVTGDAETAERVRRFINHYRRSCPASVAPPPCSVHIDEPLPPHRGLGSGTQIGLAVARGLSTLAGNEAAGIAQLAEWTGRGRRSAVGIHGFAEGGFLVDAGQSAAECLGGLACRLEMPAQWRVALLTPRVANAGLSGESEEQVFDTLGSMPEPITDRLCRIVLTEILPAIQSASFEEFSHWVFEYGRLVGEFFAPVQGGTFGSPWTDEVIARLREIRIEGAGQTSWGPTVFAFLPTEEAGPRVADAFADHAAVQISRPRNVGAVVTTEP